MRRRSFLRSAWAGASLLLPVKPGFGSPLAGRGAAAVPADTTASSNVECGPDPIFEKPAPITTAEWAKRAINGVAVAEVGDYAPGAFRGDLKPSPPHADLNAKRAVIVSWERSRHHFVFSHEASYDPWMELPDGVALCTQFFEGNNGWAELFNENGRKERNSFIDIVQSGPDRVWVRWNYFCVNKDSDREPALRGAEDYIAYPNGLVWRRLTYSTLMAGKPEGYSWQPIDFFAIAPAGTTWSHLFDRDEAFGDYHVASALAAYSQLRYDVYWADGSAPRRSGDRKTLLDISHSGGFAMVMPFKAGHLFTIMGPSSGFPAARSQIVDHSFADTGGWGWGARRWDHWPIGWVNAQAHEYRPGSPYPYHFGPFSHYLVDKPLQDAHRDYPIEARDMSLNRWTEGRVYYTLSGVGANLESIRRLAARWLDKGPACAKPHSIAELSWPE